MGKKIEYSNDELTIIWYTVPKNAPGSGSKTLRQTG